MKQLINLRHSPMWKYIRFTIITVFSLVGILVFPQTITKLVADEIPAPRKNYFQGVTLEAKAALVYDLSRHKALFAKNDKAVLPLASLTKIMTAVTALEQAPTSTVVTISREALAQEGDNGLLRDEQWTLPNLLKFSLVVSSNDGVAAISEAVGAGSRQEFVKMMNQTARTIGLTKMWFTNESGLDQDELIAGGYGSAQDLTQLIEYAVKYHPDVFQPTSQTIATFSSENNIAHTAKNTNTLVQKIPRLIAGKTGFSTLKRKKAGP
jgi:serine-type D-Ala-D-Ala carboxypeptidase (penicillin-binding protein 5/6)